jgi:hypothetical protein
MRPPITVPRGAAAGILVVVFCCGFPLVQNQHWLSQPTVTCDDVPVDLIETLVPGGGSLVVPASYDGPGIHCEGYSDPENGRSAVLVLTIEQYEDRILRPGAREAMRDYGWSKQHLVGGGYDLHVTDLALGDDAYAYTQPTDDTGDGEVRLECIVGATVLEVSYTASPSTAPLRLAAAAAVVSALVEHLR